MRTLVEKYTATQNVTVTKMNVLIRMFTLLRCMPKTGSSPPRRSINTQVNFWYLSPGPTPYIYSSSLQLSLLWSQHALLMWKLGYVLLLFKVILKKAYNFSMNKNQTSNSVFFFFHILHLLDCKTPFKTGPDRPPNILGQFSELRTYGFLWQTQRFLRK